MESIKMAVVAPNVMPLTSDFTYGGTERMIREFVENWPNSSGVELELFCAEGSSLNSKSIKMHKYQASPYPREFVDGTLGTEYLMSHLDEVLRWHEGSVTLREAYEDFVLEQIGSSQPDVINLHSPSSRLIKMLSALDSRLLVNLHNDPIGCDLYPLKNGLYITLSASQAERTHPIPSLTIDGAIDIQPNEIENEPGDNTELGEIPEDFVLYVGAIARRKGVKTALKVARTLKFPIIIAGPVLPWSPSHIDDTAGYFLKEIAPNIDGKDVIYIPSLNDKQRDCLMKAATATIVASAHEDRNWQESFGRVIPESLAQGTPIIASTATRGSLDRLSEFYAYRFNEPENAQLAANIASPEECMGIAKDLFNMDRYVADFVGVVQSQCLI